jgi:hypothetical protein
MKETACVRHTLAGAAEHVYYSVVWCLVVVMPVVQTLLTFVETTVFTKRILELGLEGPLRGLQNALLANPEAGDLDPGTGGLRKVRMADPERKKGKRGGARVHYLWVEHKRTIYLLYVYSKGDAATLTAEQKRQLRQVVTQIKHQP